MQTSLVVIVVCPDAPGIVERLAQTVAAHHGSWVESRMARLGGHFAGILRVMASAPHVAELRAALEDLRSSGMDIVVHLGDAPERPASATPATLEVVGSDRPGIVHGVFRRLAALQVNVLELHTEVEHAPMSAEALFRARAKIALPAGLSFGELRRTLEEIGSDLHVDVEVSDAESA